jgi:hypothetical protein
MLGLGLGLGMTVQVIAETVTIVFYMKIMFLALNSPTVIFLILGLYTNQDWSIFDVIFLRQPFFSHHIFPLHVVVSIIREIIRTKPFKTSILLDFTPLRLIKNFAFRKYFLPFRPFISCTTYK